MLRQLSDLQTLLAAWEHVRRNGGSAGSDGVTLDLFAEHLEDELWNLRRELLDGSYRPAPLFRFSLAKPDGGSRPLSIPAVRDRVVQTALLLLLTPLLEPAFSDASFAYRPQRGHHAAIERVERLRDTGFRWVLDTDIADYFDSLDHRLLLTQLAELLPDTDLMELLRRFLTAPVLEGGLRVPTLRGVPQGSPLSPLLANAYLIPFDRGMEAWGRPFLRYADNILVFCRSESEARNALQVVYELLTRLGLRLNESKTLVTTFDAGFRFLGATFAGDAVVRPGDTPPPTEPSADEEPEVLSAELRTLYVQLQGATLACSGDRLLLRKDEELLVDVPIFKVDAVLLFGHCVVTPAATHLCLERKVPVFFLSSYGKFYGSLASPDGGDLDLLRQQFVRAAEPESALSVAKAFVGGKIANARTVLMKQAREDAQSPTLRRALDEAAARLEQAREQAAGAPTLAALLGAEGTAASLYFDAYALLFRDEVRFTARERPARDPVNALLNFGYTLLYNNVVSYLRLEGLNPYVGMLHQPRAGHAALASDLMEEFRAPIVDRLVLRVLTRDILKPSDFNVPTLQDQVCLLKDAARTTFLKQFEAAMNAAVTHPRTGKKRTWRGCIHEQASQYVRWLHREIPDYHPLLIR